MPLLSRFRKSDDLGAFERPQLLKSIWLKGWGVNFSVHLISVGKQLTIYSRFNEDDWVELNQTSISQADMTMESILPKEITWQNPYDWQPAINLGLVSAENIQGIYISQTQKFGFAEIRLDDISSVEVPIGEVPNVIFTLGRELDQRIASGWIPTSAQESNVLLHYFDNVPLQVGFFGPFKRIVKNLTNAIERDEELAQNGYLLSALGFGFGRVEAKTTRLKQGLLQSRTDYYQWDLGSLLSLPGFSANRYPTLATLQFMMRRGIRFLNELSDAHPHMAEIFKHYVLLGAHAWHNAKSGDTEYLTRQQLVTRIIYSNSDLAIRDRESRKVILAEPKVRDSHVSSTAKFMQTSTDESNMRFVREFVEQFSSFAGSAINSGIAHYVYHLCESVGIEFPWSERLISTMIRSADSKIRLKVNEILREKPDLFVALDIDALLSVLRSDDDELADSLIMGMVDLLSKPFWYGSIEYKNKVKYWTVIDRWSASHGSKILTARDVKITKQILLASRSEMYGYQALRNRLFLQLFSADEVDNSSEFLELITSLSVEYSWPNKTENLLAFIGIRPNATYAKGVLDFLSPSTWWMISPLSHSLSRSLNSIWLTDEELQAFVREFLESGKLGAKELITEVSVSEVLYDNKVDVIRTEISRHDPTGTAFLGLLRVYIESSSSKELLQLLQFLSRDEFAPFWRRNAGELSDLFASWKRLPDFLWNNLNNLPLMLVETLKNSEDFVPRLFEILTPKKISQMNDVQRDLLADVMTNKKSLKLSDSILRALLSAPSAELNRVARDCIESEGSMDQFWLLMLESKLPVSVDAGAKYLESRLGQSDFVPKLLMALDSNDRVARRRALDLIGNMRDLDLIKEVTTALLENRNIDTWDLVKTNLRFVDQSAQIQDFTRTVFLSRRQGRSVKERLKAEIDRLFEELEHAVEKRTLLRMSRSSVAIDREWAMKKLALQKFSDPELFIEEAWKS